VTHSGAKFDDCPDQRVSTVGTDDVLTCHVVILHHPWTSTLALAHFDEFVRAPALNRFLKAFLERIRERYFSEEWEDDEFDEDWDYEYVDEDDEEDFGK